MHRGGPFEGRAGMRIFYRKINLMWPKCTSLSNKTSKVVITWNLITDFLFQENILI